MFDICHAKYLFCRLGEISITRGSSLLLHPSFIYRFTSLYAEEKEILDDLGTLAPKVISNALQKRKTDLNNGMDQDCGDSKPMILIDKLLSLKEKGLMDRQRIHDQINTFVVAVSGEELIFFSAKCDFRFLHRAPTLVAAQY